jgi:cyclophilin family peptidyl-prolyl cis-trans isomerase
VFTDGFDAIRFEDDREAYTIAFVAADDVGDIPARPGIVDELDNLSDVAAGTPTTDGETTTSATTSTTSAVADFPFGTGACPAEDGSSTRTLAFADAPRLCIDPSRANTATFSTTEGTVVVELDTTTTPGTANNFAVLGRYHYYDGTLLFRTDPSIGIIQGGSPTTQDPADPGPGYDLPDEGFDFTAIGGTGGPYRYGAGDLVMARASSANSGGAQFFFCVTDACSLLDDQGVYVVFGHVTEGLDVLERILALHVDSGPLGGQPSRPVTVDAVTIAEG